MKCFFTTSALSAMVGGRALSAFAIGPGGDFEPEGCRADVHGLAVGGAVLVRPGARRLAQPQQLTGKLFTLCLPLIRPIGSRRSPEVFVMEPTHAGHLHHTALARRLHTPWLGCVLGQR